MDYSLANLLQLLLIKNNITFDRQELEFQIQSHPSYPSLHSITGVLDHFNIDNLALNIPINKETLNELPNFFLAQVEIKNATSFVVVQKKKNIYQLFYEDKKKDVLTSDEFLDKFTGIIVAVEKSNDINIYEENKTTLTLNKASLICSFLLLGILFLLSNADNLSILYFSLSAIGIYISIAILKQEQGETSFLGDAFCSDINSKKNCNSVLTSKGAQFGVYKLSDFSLIYFSSILISTWLLTLLKSNLNILFIISLASLPITLYSIFYQYKIVKTWCLLCLSIVGVLWFQVIIILFNDYKLFVFSPIKLIDFLIISFVFLSLFIIWNFIKPNIKLIRELKASKIKFFKFKRDFNLFQALLDKSEFLNTSIKDTSEIIFGNKNAALEIVLVTSPFCGHCKPVHNYVVQILKKHSQNIKICIRFNINITNKPLVNITTRLLELYQIQGELKCLDAMHDIYSGMSIEDWTKIWGETNKKTPYLSILKLENEWCQSNVINFTPAILINGKLFPKEYERSELSYFIEDLYENVEVNSIIKESYII